jgi:TolB-like protein
MMRSGPGEQFVIGDWIVDPMIDEVSCAAGRAKLEPRMMRLLVCLVEADGAVVTAEQLLNAVWEDVVVGPASVYQTVSQLRKILGDTGKEPTYIATVARKGYRLVAPVRRLKSMQSSAAAGVSLSASEPPKLRVPMMSIAILPFANLTGDPTKEYLGDAIADELINTLARDPAWFKVPARSSAFAYKERNVQVQQIARDLDVKAVLEGSVRGGGGRVRISAQLVDGLTGDHLWSRDYERSLDDLLELQDEIAVSIADVLSFGGSGLSSGVLKCPTGNLEAFKLFLQSKSLDSQPTEHNLRTALLLLDRALALDRTFARAWQGRAVVRGYYSVTMNYAMPDALVEAERDARQALALDCNLAGAHAVLGFINACRGRWVEAEVEIGTAHSLLPNDPEVHLLHAIYVAQSAGHIRRGIEESEIACRLAPLKPPFTFTAGVSNLLADRNKEALRLIQLAIAHGLPESLEPVADALAHLAILDGRYIDAARLITGTLSAAERAAGAVDAVRCFCDALSEPSRNSAAIAALRAFQDRLPEDGLNQIVSKRLIVWYTRLNALDFAYQVANDALDRLVPYEMIGSAWGILWTPAMRAFRRDARFQTFIERLSLMRYWSQYGPPDDCELRDGRLVCS